MSSTQRNTSIKFPLKVELEVNVEDPYGQLLEPQELVSSAYGVFKVIISNQSRRIFPGGSIAVSYQEFGMTPGGTSLGFHLRNPLSVPRIRPKRSWTGTFRYTPIFTGLMIITFSVISVGGNNEVTDVELSGFRHVGSQAMPVHYNVLGRDAVLLALKLDQLNRKLGGG